VTARLGANPDYQRGWVDGVRWQRQRMAALLIAAEQNPAARVLLNELLAGDEEEVATT
jgi:ABC-type cobalamin transport system ATPase subunit